MAKIILSKIILYVLVIHLIVVSLRGPLCIKYFDATHIHNHRLVTTTYLLWW